MVKAGPVKDGGHSWTLPLLSSHSSMLDIGMLMSSDMTSLCPLLDLHILEASDNWSSTFLLPGGNCYWVAGIFLSANLLTGHCLMPSQVPDPPYGEPDWASTTGQLLAGNLLTARLLSQLVLSKDSSSKDPSSLGQFEGARWSGQTFNYWKSQYWSQSKI